MTIPRMTVLVVGATGSIGRLVIDEAIRQGHAVRALVRAATVRAEVGGRAEHRITNLKEGYGAMWAHWRP